MSHMLVCLHDKGTQQEHKKSLKYETEKNKTKTSHGNWLFVSEKDEQLIGLQSFPKDMYFTSFEYILLINLVTKRRFCKIGITVDS